MISDYSFRVHAYTAMWGAQSSALYYSEALEYLYVIVFPAVHAPNPRERLAVVQFIRRWRSTMLLIAGSFY